MVGHGRAFRQHGWLCVTQNIRAKCRVVAFKIKRDWEKLVLENPDHQHVAEAGLSHITSTIHVWGPYFCSIPLFLLHISIWRLIGPIAICMYAAAGTLLLLHSPTPLCFAAWNFPCNVLMPCLGPFWSHLSISKPGWKLWREVLTELVWHENHHSLHNSQLDSKKGAWDRPGLGTEVSKVSVIALIRLWSISKVFLSSHLRTVSDILKCLKIGSPDYKFSSLPLLKGA